MDKNLPVDSGDTGLILVRKIPHATEQLSPGTTTDEAHVPRACALEQEKPLQGEAHTMQ